MIERASELGAQVAPVVVATDTTFLSAGDMLREAREAHNLPIDVVAAALKVSVRKIEALENDDIDALPDPVFARALAASICRALRIDPAPVLAKLPGAQPSGLAQADRTISRTLRSAAPRSGVGSNRWPSRALLVVVALLLAGAALLFWTPQSVFDQIGASFARLGERQGAPTAASTEVQDAAAPAGTVVEHVQPASVAAPPTAPSIVAAPELPAPQAPPDAMSSPPAVATGNLIEFVARQDSWISVSDATGKSLLRRTVKEGETVGIPSSSALSVVVGRAAVVDVQVRGKPLDLAPLVRAGGVARFEVKP